MTAGPRTRTLPNGLRVVVDPMPGLRTFSAELQLPLGSANDPDDAIGAAALAWAWVRRGAGGRGARGRREALDAAGILTGGGAGRDATVLAASLPADAPAAALALWAEEATAPDLSEATFERARTEAVDELAAGLDLPGERCGLLLQATFLTGAHGRNPYGEEAVLEALTPARARAELARRWGPDGAVLAIAGGVEAEAAFDAAETAFGGWRGASCPVPPVGARAPGRAHEDAPAAATHLSLALPLLPPDDPRWYAQALGWAVLSGSLGARLEREVRERRGLAYDVGAGLRVERGFAWGEAHAAVAPERAGEAACVLRGELARLRDGVDEGELTRARTMLRAALSFAAERSPARAAAAAEDVRLRGRARAAGEAIAATEALGRIEVNAALAAAPSVAPTDASVGPREPGS